MLLIFIFETITDILYSFFLGKYFVDDNIIKGLNISDNLFHSFKLQGNSVYTQNKLSTLTTVVMKNLELRQVFLILIRCSVEMFETRVTLYNR